MAIEYFSEEQPDSCFLQFAIIDTTDDIASAGSYFVLDDLYLESTTTGLPGSGPLPAPVAIELYDNYPNPFNPSTPYPFPAG